MTVVAIDILGITNAAISHALTSGRFDFVNGHEPKNAPATGGLTAAVWTDRVVPVGRASGLNSASAVLILNVRVYAGALSEPADAIDPDMVAAVDDLCRAYVGDFTLGGLIKNVDVFGMYGQALDVRAGYLTQDGAPYRVITVSVPCVVNDLWEEAA